MKDLEIEYVAIEKLLPYAGNARVHSAKQVQQIAQSLKTFGFMNPVLVDASGTLIAGHGRLIAAKQLNLQQVPIIRVEHLSEAQRRAYALADNKIAENASWNDNLLRVELEYLMSADVAFDVDLTGFSTPEIDFIVHEGESTDHEESDPLPDVAVPDKAEIVTKAGDLWILGDHKILCGDCRSVEQVKSLFDGETARMVITDPPYNVPIAGHVSGLGQTQHAEFAMGVGEMTPKEFSDFLLIAIRSMAAPCVDGALMYCFMDWRSIYELLYAARSAEMDLKNLCVWVKSNGGMGSLYRSRHELVAVLKKGDAPHTNNVELGKHGRYRTNVWEYAGMNAFGAEREEALAVHPTVKPVAMIKDAILDASGHGEIVLDGFLGSGTTLLAADQTKRRCFGVELEPAYVDVAIQRWIALTGGTPVEAGTGATFDEMRDARIVAIA